MEEMKSTTIELAPGQVKVNCTLFCGFSVAGTPEYCRSMYNNHKHQVHPNGIRWHESFFENIFSFWGVIALLIIVAGIVSLVTGDVSFWK